MENENVSRNDRELILKSFNNKEGLKSLLNGIDLSIDNPLEIYNNDFNVPQYSETDKYGIIYTSKGGSSLINNLLGESKLEIDLKTSSDWHKKFQSKMVIEPIEDLSLLEHGDFDSILEGKSKKDLIIVTRNPIYKFLSGLWQELEIEFGKSYSLLGFLSKEFSDDEINKKLVNVPDKVLTEIVYTFLKGLINSGNPICWSHAALYNETFYNFLELNSKLDKSKLKIIDIDSTDGDLVNLLSSYHPSVNSSISSKLFWSHRKKHYKIINALIEKSRKDFQIQKVLSRELNRDFYYYNLLKTRYNKNFYKG